MTTQLVPSGPYRLRASAEFGFGQRHAQAFDGVMRLAFLTDGGFRPVAVALRQAAPDGPVDVDITGDADPALVLAQTARMLGLDHDAETYPEVGLRDPVVGRLMRVRPGLRPPLFHSAYEAAAWCVLSARRPAAQMAAVRDRLAREHGTVFTVAGQELAAFPAPGVLATVDEIPGLPQPKVDRLHAVARAALEGGCDTATLRSLPADDAAHRLQQLPGVGPFYAALIVLRALGHADEPVTAEPRLLALLGELYGLTGPAHAADATRIASAWRPWRTWVAVLVRAAGAELLARSREAVGAHA